MRRQTSLERRAGSAQTLYSYTIQARELLDRHNLIVSDVTVEMVAKTIAKRYKVGSGRSKGPSPRERISKALAHAGKLVEYADRRKKDRRLAASISTRSVALLRALADIRVVIRLAITTSLDVVEVLERLKRSELSKDDLTHLIAALKSVLPTTGKSGRPREEIAHVIRGACIAWLRAGRDEKYTWDEASGILKDPLAAFARDFLKCCQLSTPTDNALYCTLRAALPDCREAVRHTR